MCYILSVIFFYSYRFLSIDSVSYGNNRITKILLLVESINLSEYKTFVYYTLNYLN